MLCCLACFEHHLNGRYCAVWRVSNFTSTVDALVWRESNIKSSSCKTIDDHDETKRKSHTHTHHFTLLVNSLGDSCVQRLLLQHQRHLWLLMFCILHGFLSCNCSVTFCNLTSLGNFAVQCVVVSCNPALYRAVRLAYFVNLFTSFGGYLKSLEKFSVWPTELVLFGIGRSLVTFVIASLTRSGFRGKPTVRNTDRRSPFVGDSCHRGSRLAQGFVGNQLCRITLV